MKIGDKVLVSPLFSMKFAKRWGVIKGVKEEDGLAFKLNFGEPVNYGFSASELITESVYFQELLNANYVKTQDKRLLKIKDASDKLNIVTDSGIYSMYELIPVAHCTTCGLDISGTLEEICEECRYPS